MLPEPKRSALYGVYAWMRLVDDIADDDVLPPAIAREQLEHVRAMTRGVFAGTLPQQSNDPALWQAMLHTASDFHLDIDPFEHMIDGQLEDLEHRGYETFEDLRTYCHRVASTVGLICIDVWGHTDHELAHDLAVEQGIAFQLTNILRDFRVDFANDRVYLATRGFPVSGPDTRAARRMERCAGLYAVHPNADRAGHGLLSGKRGTHGACQPRLSPDPERDDGYLSRRAGSHHRPAQQGGRG